MHPEISLPLIIIFMICHHATISFHFVDFHIKGVIEMLKRTTYGISHMLYPKRDGDYSIVLSATLSSARDI